MVMTARDEKLVRGSHNFQPQMACLPSLSSGESEMQPHFRRTIERLSDSDSSKSGSDDDSARASNRNVVPDQTRLHGSKSSIPSCDGSRKRKSEDSESATNKKQKLTNGACSKPVISSAAQKMMAKMGYTEGSGLGKREQGRTVPIEASKQKGRRGLGAVIASVDRDLIQYDPTKEFKDVYEEFEWLDGGKEIDLSADELLEKWYRVGSKKRVLDDESHFCDPNTLKLVLICKSAFDKMSGEEMRRARSRSNPFELIKKGPYQNRAAMKMANINTLFKNMFTNPVDEHGKPMVGPDEILYFADVCAGPGGFSEYILSQKKWHSKGFGFTLKNSNDFKLDDFYAGPSESFEPFYGAHGDGDVYKWENIISFSNYVNEHSNHGVHFMMADGGFSVEGSENIQEILSKRLYLCQCLVALSIVRTGGHFVCKLFDVFTPFSVGIIYILYRCFKKISIMKPNTSRPANSERYIICQSKLENVDHVRDYLLAVNKDFDKYGEASEKECNELVALDVLKNDQKFYDYILRSNNLLAERQINSLAKILLYSEDETLVEDKQQDLKKLCMEAWGVPIRARSGPSNTDPDALIRNLFKNDTSCLRSAPTCIENLSQLQPSMRSIHDWYSVILGSDSRNGCAATFFLGVGHKRCYKFDLVTKKWLPFRDPIWELELSPNTLVFGEVVSEATCEGRGQMKRNVFHIIDGHTLGGEYIGSLHYTKRVQLCSLYARAINRPSMNTLMSIRMKTIYEMDQLEEKSFYTMKPVIMKNMSEDLGVPLDSSCEQFYIPRGIMFLKATKFPYIRWISTSQNLKYYSFPDPKVPPKFDQDRPDNASNDFKETYAHTKIWYANKDIDPSQFNAQQFVLKLVHFIRDNKYKKNCA